MKRRRSAISWLLVVALLFALLPASTVMAEEPDPNNDPATSDPSTSDPGTSDPGTSDPSTTDPGTTSPSTGDPTSPVTKLVLAELLYDIFQLSPPDPSYNFPFTDCDDLTAEQKTKVAAVAVKGWMNGTDGKLDPSATIIREMGTKIITIICFGRDTADNLSNPSSPPYSDVAADRWSANSIAYCKDSGLLTTVPDSGPFRPTDLLTRGDAAAWFTATHDLMSSMSDRVKITLDDAIQFVPCRKNINAASAYTDFAVLSAPPGEFSLSSGGVLDIVSRTSGPRSIIVSAKDGTGSKQMLEISLNVKAATSGNLSLVAEPGYGITKRIEDKSGLTGSVQLICEGSVSALQAVFMDGKRMIEDTHYTVKSGSTIITFPESTLRTAGYGTHTVSLAYSDSYGTLHVAAQNFTIQQATATTSPITMVPPATTNTTNTTNKTNTTNTTNKTNTTNTTNKTTTVNPGGTPKVTVYNPDGGTVQAFYYGAVEVKVKTGWKLEKLTLNDKVITLPANGKLTNLTSNDRVSVTFKSLTAMPAVAPNPVITPSASPATVITTPPATTTTTTPAASSANTSSMVFVDVPPNAYYYNAVQWALGQNITKGEGNGRFNPDAVCSRAEMLTLLWRACGSPSAGENPRRFSDVPAGSYYENAVQWAAALGIVKGEGNNCFNPYKTVTRGETVTFLYRAAGSPQVGLTPVFTDVPLDAYYAMPVQWALNGQIAKGLGNKQFQPGQPCTRAQVVTFLQRSRGGG